MLRVDGLHVAYGGLPALDGVSLHVDAGELVAVVGPNGAGKTTLFKTISGIVRPTAGDITFSGQDVLAVPAARRAHLGIAHVPEGRQVFPSLTVGENLALGAYTEAGQRAWAENLERIHTWFPVLAERSDQLAGTLSGGEQQMLAIGRGIASAPKLLMLDEPSMGLAPAIADDIFERIVEIHRNDPGLAVLLVEQRVTDALHHASRGYVLEAGTVVLQGDRAALENDDRIRRAYLGM